MLVRFPGETKEALEVGLILNSLLIFIFKDDLKQNKPSKTFLILNLMSVNQTLMNALAMELLVASGHKGIASPLWTYCRHVSGIPPIDHRFGVYQLGTQYTTKLSIAKL